MPDNETLPEHEIAARDLRALIDTIAERDGLSMQCAALLSREDWTGDKHAQHRQCVIAHKTGPVSLPSIVVTYSAGSLIPFQWIERVSKTTRAKFQHAPGASGLAWRYREAVRMDGPQWWRKVMHQDLAQHIRAAWKPDLFDVLSSCLRDSDVTDYATFEDWADATGYETDSRKAEATYRECRNIAKQMRILFGADFDRARELAGQM